MLKTKWGRLLATVLLAAATCAILLTAHANGDGFIRYAEFNVPYAALDRALRDDIAARRVSWG